MRPRRMKNLKAHRMLGEWFAPHIEVLTFVSEKLKGSSNGVVLRS
jgi:hypothetical protein